MGKVTGFLEFDRSGPRYRPVPVRLRDWREVYEPQSDEELSQQGARCMDCGIPFCMQGCPLGNRIPVFNDGVFKQQWERAASQLFATNNFPEFTGRLCPAPCESACVLAISSQAVTIERLEYEVAEHAFALGLAVSTSSAPESGRRVAVVGSGPAGLAVAAQLRSVGHAVSVYERSDQIGGLLRYGIPEFKMEKRVLDRRLEVMRASGIKFYTNVTVGAGGTPLRDLQRNHDAVVLALGATRPRLIPVPGADLIGVHPAMTYLEASNRAVTAHETSPINAAGQHVIILGGGDTGADCLGTAHRQGALSVHQIEIMDRPPDERPADQPWPTMARLFKTTSAHEEGGDRQFSTETLAFLGDDRVRAIKLRDHASDQIVELPADLVLIAAGFLGPELAGLELDGAPYVNARSSLAVSDQWRLTSYPGETPVFACGDAVRGQSLIVWAIAEGRSCAAAVDTHLRGGATTLPAPVVPYEVSW
ncbi:MAG: glutamate synthase subunit beta [Acidobacteriota bacterium]|nr:glutamate synthase subunit beta [Acidobacteriota bacterium]MDE3043821.1 glutamate synthase subunit beta [Acidobacteriota bacterium]MDE3106715.1 glutamate synthase subunit beta [Acidobacteriota bacterium]MDE3223213.1 glutamate synthase subunit beta [Acidobacteriota bacterium]